MIYSTFKDKSISALGLGGMRFPKNEDGTVNISALRELVDFAIENGINYFDTAWGYHGGESETVLGEVLSAYPRESYFLADKFPGYDLAYIDMVKEIFPKQLEKCRTDYFDFYLFHNVSEVNIEQYLDPARGIFDYLVERKREGKIRHLGFSGHGSLQTLERFLDAYGEEMEFGMIQLNWLDYTFQNAREKVKLFSSYGIPVWVMEPVRGGKLLHLDEKHKERLAALAPERTLAEWAFRFVQSIPEVKFTLSGMSNLEQLKENIATFSEKKPLNDKEMQTILDIGREITSVGTHPCTSCRYCTEYCPRGLNIPWLIELYNTQIYSGRNFERSMGVEVVSENKRPTACIGCRACEAVCPQNIKISEVMAEFAEKIAKKA